MPGVLGKTVAAPLVYSPEILEAIERSASREQLDFGGHDQIFGADVWHLYELSWLERDRGPVSFCGVLTIPCDAPATVESKSLKLYLNSLNFHEFPTTAAAIACISADLSALTRSEVTLTLIAPVNLAEITQEIQGELLDAVVPEVVAPDLMPEGVMPQENGANAIKVTRQRVAKRWISHNLRSLCPVTGQPDWATLLIDYEGYALDVASLRAYVYSYRTHQEYHEQCVERIFADLLRVAEPTRLTVSAFYLRRGGVDITPWRSTQPGSVPLTRTGRQ